jgi:pyruvate formate lyase activating enzyme
MPQSPLHPHRYPHFAPCNPADSALARAAGSASGRDPVPVAGMAKLTTIDYPHHLSAVFFLQGCPWRCAYCHNRDLQSLKSDKPGVSWRNAIEFLASRQGLLDAVVFSGGEPTIHPGLATAMREVRALGFKIGLHTNGMFPDRMKALLSEGLIDWAGVDVKATRWLYAPVTGVTASAGAVYQTLRLLSQSDIPFEARTTVYRPLLGDNEIVELARELSEVGVGRLRLQSWRPEHEPGEFVPEEDLSALQGRVDSILHRLTFGAYSASKRRLNSRVSARETAIPISGRA